MVLGHQALVREHESVAARGLSGKLLVYPALLGFHRAVIASRCRVSRRRRAPGGRDLVHVGAAVGVRAAVTVERRVGGSVSVGRVGRFELVEQYEAGVAEVERIAQTLQTGAGAVEVAAERETLAAERRAWLLCAVRVHETQHVAGRRVVGAVLGLRVEALEFDRVGRRFIVVAAQREKANPGVVEALHEQRAGVLGEQRARTDSSCRRRI